MKACVYVSVLVQPACSVCPSRKPLCRVLRSVSKCSCLPPYMVPLHKNFWDDIFGLCLCLSHQFTQLRFGNTRRWWETLGDILNRDKSCDYTKWGHLQFTMWVWAFGWKFRAHPLSWVTPTPARTEPLTENSLPSSPGFTLTVSAKEPHSIV